jgi:hypothetical protein
MSYVLVRFHQGLQELPSLSRLDTPSHHLHVLSRLQLPCGIFLKGIRGRVRRREEH